MLGIVLGRVSTYSILEQERFSMRRTDKQELIYVTEEKTTGREIFNKVYGIGDKEYTTISVQLGLPSNQGRGVTSYERSQIDNYIRRRMKFTKY